MNMQLNDYDSDSLAKNTFQTTGYNMSQIFDQSIIDAIKNVSLDRSKLVVLLGAFGTGKTRILKKIAKKTDGVYLNLNWELSERLLKMPRNAMNDGVTVHKLIDEICDFFSPKKEILFVDNIELLFSPELGKINPVDTFKRISRQRPVVIALPAFREGNLAVYSTPDSQDYFPVPLEDFVTIEVEKE